MLNLSYNGKLQQCQLAHKKAQGTTKQNYHYNVQKNTISNEIITTMSKITEKNKGGGGGGGKKKKRKKKVGRVGVWIARSESKNTTYRVTSGLHDAMQDKTKDMQCEVAKGESVPLDQYPREIHLAGYLGTCCFTLTNDQGRYRQ